MVSKLHNRKYIQIYHTGDLEKKNEVFFRVMNRNTNDWMSYVDLKNILLELQSDDCMKCFLDAPIKLENGQSVLKISLNSEY